MRKLFLYLITTTLYGICAAQPVVITGGPDNDIIGRICILPDQRIIAVVERNPGWSSGDLYASFSSDMGNTWSALAPVVVEPGNQSTFCVAVTHDDSVRVWYASNHSGYYRIYSVSSSDGIAWTEGVENDLGWEATAGIYDPHVIVEADGSMTMTYIRLNGGGYVAHCEEINVWDKKKTQVQPGAYRMRVCKHDSGLYLVAYHRNMGGNQYDVNVKTSIDLSDWSEERQLTFTGNSHDPYCNLFEGGYMAVFTTYKNGAYNLHKMVSPDGEEWSEPEQITFDMTHNTQPCFFGKQSGGQETLMLVYTHAIDYDTDNDIWFQSFVATSVSHEPDNVIDTRIYLNGSGELIIEPGYDFETPAKVSVFKYNGVLIARQFIIHGKNRVVLPSEMSTAVIIVRVEAGNRSFIQKMIIP